MKNAETNYRKGYVFDKFNELVDAIRLDVFNLSVDEQTSLLNRLQEFKTKLDEIYSN